MSLLCEGTFQSQLEKGRVIFKSLEQIFATTKAKYYYCVHSDAAVTFCKSFWKGTVTYKKKKVLYRVRRAVCVRKTAQSIGNVFSVTVIFRDGEREKCAMVSFLLFFRGTFFPLWGKRWRQHSVAAAQVFENLTPSLGRWISWNTLS